MQRRKRKRDRAAITCDRPLCRRTGSRFPNSAEPRFGVEIHQNATPDFRALL